MRKSGLISNLRPFKTGILTSLFFVQVLFCKPAKCVSDLPDNIDGNDGMVDVYYRPATDAPYSEKRGSWGFTLSGNMENFSPKKFTSSRDGLSYTSLFGSKPVQLAQAELGVKYNILFGALELNVIGGYGKVLGTVNGLDRTLSILKRSASAEIVLDNIMKEPYVAPYMKLQALDFTFEDKGSANGNSKGTTAWTTGITAGFLIQLNHLDPTDTARVASDEYGLSNTYLDVFGTKYNTSNAPDDPNFETDFNWGVGLAFEF